MDNRQPKGLHVTRDLTLTRSGQYRAFTFRPCAPSSVYGTLSGGQLNMLVERIIQHDSNMRNGASVCGRITRNRSHLPEDASLRCSSIAKP